MEFGILGPIVVRTETGDIRISGARRRGLLVRLLVTANELVPAGRLADDLWAGEPPSGAASTLQSHISFLRRALGSGRLVGRDGGYVLEVVDHELDVRRFEDELRRGRDALVGGDPGGAARLLVTALGRWRGRALADVSGTPWAVPEEARLEELHIGAIETWLEARLVLGEHREVVALAEGAIADHPLREEIWSYLMLALYRSGRQADALRAYQRLRTLLGEELGISPSARLVALDDAIVQQKSELDWSGAPAIRRET
jgi:DNA-binding SARP family transcriptional activator